MNDHPRRVQLRRTKGWRMPDGAIKVDRSTPWGNPFRVGDPGVADAQTACDLFRAAILLADYGRRCTTEQPSMIFGTIISAMPGPIPRIGAIHQHLRGRDLACWCPLDQPCHADVLLEIANAHQET